MNLLSFQGQEVLIKPGFEPQKNRLDAFNALFHTVSVQLEAVTVMNDMTEFPVWRQIRRQGVIK